MTVTSHLLLFEVTNCDLKFLAGSQSLTRVSRGVVLVIQYVRTASPSVPKANNLDRSVVVIDSVDDSIRPYDNLANGLMIKFWYHSASFREMAQTLGVSN